MYPLRKMYNITASIDKWPQSRAPSHYGPCINKMYCMTLFFFLGDDEKIKGIP